MGGACAEQFRDLDGHLAGVAGGTEDEDVLPGVPLGRAG
jgi:hypothetical protein